MQIGAIGSSVQTTGSNNTPDQARKLFGQLDEAIKSGDLTSAKNALTDLQKIGPRNGSKSDQINSKISALSEAIDSGDTTKAQVAYADLKKTMTANRPGGSPPAHGGRPQGGPRGASGGNKTSDSNKVYDERDANKDGKVSELEQISYDLTHPKTDEDKATSTGASQQLDVIA